MLHEALKLALQKSTSHRELIEVMDYAVLPAGKLFRPRLVEALALDLQGKVLANHLHLASAIEIHHAYTLVHDDLPAMDNDLMRRGRPSTHAAYGEWKAILAGDALLISSFEELMKITHPKIREIHRLFTWATGARGLISGQFRDLAAQGKLGLQDIIRIHELKTARLIQVATVGTYLLSRPETNLRGLMEFLRLGQEIGVSFQLLDDLNELTDEVVSPHEHEINPFLISPHKAHEALSKSHGALHSLIKRNKLHKLDEMLQDYFKKNQSNILGKFSILKRNIPHLEVLKNVESWLTQIS